MPSSTPSPCILRETSSGISRVSVYDEMLERRELSVAGEIDRLMAYDCCQQALGLARRDPRAPVTVFVDSPGGAVSAGLAIYDVLRGLPCPVRTVCLDTAASMGCVVFMAGETRLMYPHAELMVHDPLIPQGAGGTALSVQEASRRLMDTRETLNRILSERTGCDLERIERLTERETFLSADEAVRQGFATGIAGADAPGSDGAGPLP